MLRWINIAACFMIDLSGNWIMTAFKASGRRVTAFRRFLSKSPAKFGWAA
jgi:hypothetical protein